MNIVDRKYIIESIVRYLNLLDERNLTFILRMVKRMAEK